MLLSRTLCIFSACLTLAGGLLQTGAAGAQPVPYQPDQASEVNDFHVIRFNNPLDSHKFLSFGWNGWSGRTVRWRYNDANRPANIVASSSATVARVQTAMGKWSAVCNVQFVYDGTTTNAASLATNTRDGVNVIAWAALAGTTTGITYVGASGFTGQMFTLDEGDMLVNYQYNPSLDSTLLHEVGHLLGLKHSNQESAVMSGPNTAPDPSTTYTGLAALQADDIAGCVSLYGASGITPTAPVATASTATLAFANTTVGSTTSGTSVTLTNTGTAALAINYTVVSGADFSLLSTTCNAGTSLSAGATCVATVRFTPTAAGARSGTLSFGHNAATLTTNVALSGNGVASPPTPAPLPPTRTMVEYRFVPLDYYFMTSRDFEKATLDATSGFARTGASFLVYAQAQDSLRPITRFYFDRVALGATRGSHFYTLLDSELVTLAQMNPTGSAAPGFAQNEGIDSYAYLPLAPGVGGFCAGGLQPVYRLFRGNERFPDNPNHRFTTSTTTYNDFVSAGWDGEGVKFCVPAN